MAGSQNPRHPRHPGYGRQEGRLTERRRRSRSVGGHLLRQVDVMAALRSARQTGSLQVLVLLLLPIPFLLVAHQLYFWDIGPFTSPRWAVNGDRTFIEIFGYVQLAVAVVMLLFVGWRRRAGLVYAGWAAVLTVTVLDDALALHERGGGELVRRGLVPGLLGLPEQVLGELATWALLGIPVLLLLVVMHRSSRGRARQDFWALAMLFGLLLFFAVGVDVLHEAVEEITDNSVIDLAVTFVESGGEIAAMTALLAYVVHIIRRPSVGPEQPPVTMRP